MEAVDDFICLFKNPWLFQQNSKQSNKLKNVVAGTLLKQP